MTSAKGPKVARSPGTGDFRAISINIDAGFVNAARRGRERREGQTEEAERLRKLVDTLLGSGVSLHAAIPLAQVLASSDPTS